MATILAIDDHPDNLVSINAILKDLIPGCHMITALSGAEGIETAMRETPDTILLDIKMPGMDGYEVCKRLKENEVTRHIPVIMISAIKKEPEDYAKGLECGADGYLPKPIDEHVLVAQVNSALRTKKAEDQLRNQKADLDQLVRRQTAELMEKNRQLIREIDERRQAEKSLKESEEKYRSMMEAMEDAAFICSPDFCLEYQNPAMTERIGRDATGELCYKVMHGRDEKCPGCIHAKVMRGEYVKTETVSPKDGKIFSVSHSPIFHTDGTVSKFSIFRDITETKKLTERLDQAQRMEAIGTLAGGIAHDFNNILFPIIGLSEMLLEEMPKDSPDHENLQAIHTAATRAGGLVKQILSFSRQAEHQKIPVRVQHILKEVLKLTRSTIPSNIEITQLIQGDCGLVMADPSQVHQIAMNLVTNAYHAVEASGGGISIELKEAMIAGREWAGATLKPGKYAAITVSDTGHGIAPEVMGKIFEPYFTTKSLGKGTGLGLSVVHGIIKDHGGDIRVESQPGKGAAFTVYLPVLKMALEAVSRENPVIYESGTESILLVDDEEPIVRLEQMMLERLGYRITTRTSSIHALDTFGAHPDAFDLVITDMTMPIMTGDRLAGELRLIKPGIPIILCTGFTEKMDEQRAREMGVNGFLMKPVVKSDLARMVRNVLRAERGC
ncbi:MAG: response regulator [Pseudomonadota bacterium]